MTDSGMDSLRKAMERVDRDRDKIAKKKASQRRVKGSGMVSLLPGISISTPTNHNTTFQPKQLIK